MGEVSYHSQTFPLGDLLAHIVQYICQSGGAGGAEAGVVEGAHLHGQVAACDVEAELLVAERCVERLTLVGETAAQLVKLDAGGAPCKLGAAHGVACARPDRVETALVVSLGPELADIHLLHADLHFEIGQFGAVGQPCPLDRVGLTGTVVAQTVGLRLGVLKVKAHQGGALLEAVAGVGIDLLDARRYGSHDDLLEGRHDFA